MAEIYKYSNDPIKIKAFSKGEIAISTLPVLATVYDITNDPFANPPVDPNVPAGIFSAVEDEVNPGTYYITMPFSMSTRNKKLKILWQFNLAGTVEILTTYCDIVTPYVNISEIVEDLNFGADPSDPRYKSYHDLQMAEKFARKTIEAYTGQRFYLFDETFTVMGNDSSHLPLPRKINSIHTLHQNDQLWIDNLEGVNSLGYVVEPTTSGFGIKINQSSLLDGDVYIANGMVPPSIHDISPNIFRNGKYYKVYGRFGWDHVPNNVEQATIELIKTYFSKDRTWKDQYVKKLSTTDWDFEYRSEIFSGTGSAYADKLLQDYVVTQMVVI